MIWDSGVGMDTPGAGRRLFEHF